MKSTTCILLVIVALSAQITVADTTDTYQSKFHMIRAIADEDGATFAAVYNLTTDGDFSSKDSNSVAAGGPFHIPARIQQDAYGPSASPGAAWLFSFCGKNYNNVDDTFSFTLVGWAKENGPLQVLCEGDCVLGTQAVINYPEDVNSSDLSANAQDALGELITVTDANYTDGTTTFVDSTDTGSFSGAVAGMLAYVEGTNITTGYYQITTVTDANTIVMSGITASGDNSEASTIKINPAFWADTINLDEVTKWPNVTRYNASGDNQIGILSVDLTGIEWIQFIIYDADAATGEQAGDIAVFGRRY